MSIDQITQARLIPDAFRNELSESDDDTEVWLVLVEKIKALRVADSLGSEQRNLSVQSPSGNRGGSPTSSTPPASVGLADHARHAVARQVEGLKGGEGDFGRSKER